MGRLSPLQFDGDELAYLRIRIDQLKESWEHEQETYIKTLELNRQQLQDRVNRLTDAYIDRLIDKETFENRKTALLIEQRAIDENLHDVRTGKLSIPEQIDIFLERARSAYSSYISGFPEEKRHLLKQTTSNRVVEGKNVVIALESPFQEIASRTKFLIGDPTGNRTRITSLKS